MNLDVFLSLFSLMLVSLAVYVVAEKIKIPYTVLLVIVGSMLVPLSTVESFSFITSFDLTPELLFFVFLPILIFESAYNIKIDDMLANIRAISLLAIVGLLLSTAFIGLSGFYLFNYLGFHVPLMVMLLFGAIISATDPVAVLALFKQYGAPRRLTLIFEGESLFNDGTAFAAFLVIMSLMQSGVVNAESLTDGLLDFCVMLFGGILFGMFMGFLFSKLIEWVKGYEHLEITLTLLVAHFTFILTEVISEHIIVAGHAVHFSPIIATMVSSMVIGNFGRFKMSPDVEEYMEKFWGYFAFVANSLVFILMGLLFVEQSISLNVAWMPIVISIVLVMIGRAVAIYPVLGFLNFIKKEEKIPLNWMHLLSWGSLRGSLAVIMVLLIPDDLTLPGWRYAFTIKEFLTAIVIGCIYFTLLVKALSIEKIIHKLGIDKLTEFEEVGYFKSKALIFDEVINTLNRLLVEKKISQRLYNELVKVYQKKHDTVMREYHEKVGDDRRQAERLLRVYVLGTEKAKLREIYCRGEINEKIYKKILNLLDIQMQRVEKGSPQLETINERFPVDMIEGFINLIRKLLFLPSPRLSPQELYVYYRAQYKLLQGAIANLENLHHTSLSEIFDDQHAVQKTIYLYQKIAENTKKNLELMIEENYELVVAYNAEQGAKAIALKERDTLRYLSKNEIITPKLSIMLQKELLEKDTTLEIMKESIRTGDS